MVFFMWFMLAIAVGFLAGNRGRSGFWWFVLAMLISPLLGFIFVLIAADLSKQATSTTPGSNSHVRCPACAEWVLPEASVCKHCGAHLTPDPLFHSKVVTAAKNAKASDTKDLLVGVGSIAAMIAIAAAISKCTGS
jgi:hypothetical protein